MSTRCISGTVCIQPEKSGLYCVLLILLFGELYLWVHVIFIHIAKT